MMTAASSPAAILSPQRRRTLLGLLAAAGSGLLPACSRAKPLVASIHPFPPYHLLQWASQRASVPIRWNRVATATQQRQRIRFRQVQAALLTLDEALRERALGTPLVVIGMIDQSVGTDQLLVRPGWEEPQRLRTARVGLEPTGVCALTYLAALRHFGLPLDWSHIVPLAPAEQFDAWQQGKIDAVVTFDPFARALRAAGAVPLFDSRQMPPLILDVIVAHEAFLASHAEGLEALLASWVAAVSTWQRDPQAVAQELAPLAGLTPAELIEAFAGVRLFTCSENHTWLQRGLHDTSQQITELLQVAQLGPFPAEGTIPATPRFVPLCPDRLR